MKKISLKAQERKTFGRKVKNVRNEGMIPSNIFGKGVKSKAIKVDEKEFLKVFDEAGETSIVEVLFGKENRPCLIHGIQKDPVSEKVLHVDFHQVNLKEKVSADVPIEVVGEAPAVKQGLGTLVTYIDEVEVEALPMDLPEKFEINVNGLKEVDDALHIKDLDYDKSKVELDADPEEIVVKIEALREEEEEPEPEAPAEGEEGEEAEKEGEEKAPEEEGQKEESEEAPKENQEEK